MVTRGFYVEAIMSKTTMSLSKNMSHSVLRTFSSCAQKLLFCPLTIHIIVVPMLKEGTPDTCVMPPECTNKDDNDVSVLEGQGTGGMLSIHYPRSRLLSTQLRSA